MEEIFELLEPIWSLAQKKENKDGFTLYLPDLFMATDGWVIANSATQNCFGRDGLAKVIEFAMAHNRIVGGYVNKMGIYQFDAVIIEPDEEKARLLMELYEQDCIYHLRTGKMIWRGH